VIDYMLSHPGNGRMIDALPIEKTVELLRRHGALP
jgi:hypothetical protein